MVSEAAAQRVPLGQAQAAYPEGLSSVAGVRQLSDGRLMLSDRLGQAVMIVDIENGVADTIGHVGNLGAAAEFPGRGLWGRGSVYRSE